MNRIACAALMAAATLAGCVSAEPDVLPELKGRFPDATLDELRTYLSEERTILADDIVVFLSHDPFFTWSTFNGSFANEAYDPEKGVGLREVLVPDQAIIRREEGGVREGKPLTVTIERADEAATTEDALPRATIGDGLVLIATRRIVLHYDLRPTAERPAQLRAQGAGHAVLFKANGEPRKQRGTAVKVTLNVVPAENGFRVNHGEEVLQ